MKRRRHRSDLDGPQVFTEVRGPLCSPSFPVDSRAFALGVYCVARALGQAPDRDAQAVVDDMLARVNRGEDPRAVFPRLPRQGGEQGDVVLSAGPADKRRKDHRDLWREQLMAAEVLRLTRLRLCASEAIAKGKVAEAFEVDDLKPIERALTSWRGELEAGALDRYIRSLQDRGAID